MSCLSELHIPHMGSVENAKLTTWLIAEGEAFKAGQRIYEVETDKTVTEVEADADGILARRDAHEGDDKKVGDLIGYVATPGASSADIKAALQALATPAAAATSPHPTAIESVAAPASSSAAMQESAQRHSPLTRRLAAEHQVDLAQITGTGPNGKITGDDVLRVANSKGKGVVNTKSDAQRPAGYEQVPAEAIANSSRRRAISRRLAEAAHVTATLTADMQIDLSDVFAERARLKAQGSAPSVLAYIAHATCRVLRELPLFNATFTESHTLLWKPVNLGIAVDTAEGLVVPVIRDADTLSVAELDAAVRTLAQRARDGQLQQTELECGTFTISNPGSLGPVLRAEAIINLPQVAILGVPAVLHTPVAIEEPGGSYSMAVRPVIRPSLSFDHRALDGGQVIAFLNALKRLLETPRT